MRYHALAADYDGTLAHDGHVSEAMVTALKKLKESGRKLVLVTGRELDQLVAILPEIDVFDRVVAENGALIYDPQTRAERPLGDAPPPEFVAELRRRGVGPISVGRVIVATWEPHQGTVLDVIHKFGLELQVIFNKGAVMVLPSGVNKASGLSAALCELGISPHNAVGVGDAENDHAFLAACECGVAVENALGVLKERADWVTARPRGQGVRELIDRIDTEDLAFLEPKLTRHHLLLGTRDDDREVRIPPYGCNILVAGTSGSGKSTLTTGFLERLAVAKYQFAIIDPEGDYADLAVAVIEGDPRHAPTADQVTDLLAKPEMQNTVVNLLGLAMADRPNFFDGLLPRLYQLRAGLGRPHWIVVDEAHHLLPAAWDPAVLTLPQRLEGMLFITVHPESVARPALEAVNLILAVGAEPEKTLRAFCEARGQTPPRVEPTTLEKGEALAWWTDGRQPPFRVRSEPPKAERQRHSRKYAEGNLGHERSFYFRGPDAALNLRAQNLVLFSQIAQGVDDPTWLFHLERGDYTRWFRGSIKDDDLAAEAERVAAERGLSARESRDRILKAIEERYTLPAEPAGSVTDPSKFG